MKAERRHDQQVRLLVLAQSVERVPISFKAGAGHYMCHVQCPGTRDNRLHCLVMVSNLGIEARVMEMTMRINGCVSCSCACHQI